MSRCRSPGERPGCRPGRTRSSPISSTSWSQGLPADARAQFARFVEPVAESPLGGLLVDPDQVSEFPTLLWPLETAHGYGQVLYTVYHRPDEVVRDPARVLESARVVIDDVIWLD